MTLGLEEQLVSLFIRELNYFVFYRRTITRTDPLDLTGIKRRLVKIIANRLMGSLARIANKALPLRLLDLFRSERKGYGLLIRRLRFKSVPVYSSAVEA